MNPGCYGSAVSVSAASASCRVCSRRVGCVLEATDLVASMPDTEVTRRERQVLSVTRAVFMTGRQHGTRGEGQRTVVASSRGVKRVSLTEREQQLVASLPSKVGSQLKTLLERGWFEYAREEIRAGRNPATTGWKKVLCRLILVGGASRAELQAALVTELGMTESSARVQASIALAVFAGGRLAVESEGRIRLSSN